MTTVQRGQREVVTLDGPQGSGKSTLAVRLAEEFGGRVIEIGPIFRLIAWARLEWNLSSSRESAAFVAAGFEEGRIIVARRAHEFAAVGILVEGKPITDRLWESRLVRYVKEAAEDEVTVKRVGELCRNRLVRSGRTVVVGREAGARFFPDASLRVELWARPDVGLERKVRQLAGRLSGSEVEGSEASIYPRCRGNLIRVDTTSLDAHEVGRVICSLIRQRIGWMPKRGSGKAYSDAAL